MSENVSSVVTNFRNKIYHVSNIMELSALVLEVKSWMFTNLGENHHLTLELLKIEIPKPESEPIDPKSLIGYVSIFDESEELTRKYYRESLDFQRRQAESSLKIELAKELLNSILKSVKDKVIAMEKPMDVSGKVIIISRKVFIVHGHDTGMKQATARFIERLNMIPIILHEQPNKGMQTIIEKLYENSEVGYAIILMSPDDKGAPRSSIDYKYRARQNVVFEHGFYMGILGRDRVSCLYFKPSDGDMDLMSDIQGVVYTEYDESESWKYKLAKDLKAAGYDIDMNLI